MSDVIVCDSGVTITLDEDDGTLKLTYDDEWLVTAIAIRFTRTADDTARFLTYLQHYFARYRAKHPV